MVKEPEISPSYGTHPHPSVLVPTTPKNHNISSSPSPTLQDSSYIHYSSHPYLSSSASESERSSLSEPHIGINIDIENITEKGEEKLASTTNTNSNSHSKPPTSSKITTPNPHNINTNSTSNSHSTTSSPHNINTNTTSNSNSTTSNPHSTTSNSHKNSAHQLNSHPKLDYSSSPPTNSYSKLGPPTNKLTSNISNISNITNKLTSSNTSNKLSSNTNSTNSIPLEERTINNNIVKRGRVDEGVVRRGRLVSGTELVTLSGVESHNTNNISNSKYKCSNCSRGGVGEEGVVVSPMSSSSGNSDLYQRQPLLLDSSPNHKGREWDDYDSPTEQIELSKENKLVKINIPASVLSSSSKGGDKFPQERLKTVGAFLWIVFNFMLATVSLALTHERLPDPLTSPALPDIILDNIQAQDWALTVSEILLSSSTLVAFIIIIFHKHRWIVFRRVFFILGCLYLMRSVTIYVTVLPVASRSYALHVCAPKANSTSVLLIARRALQLMSGFGLSMNGQHVYCGDYMYSGHTVVLVASYLFIKEYSSKRCVILHWVSFTASLVGVVMILISRGHYTVDVLVAYFVTTRLFWIYHTMANNLILKNDSPTNFLARVWWFPIFRFLEGNIRDVVPRSSNCPSACLSKLYRRLRRNNRI